MFTWCRKIPSYVRLEVPKSRSDSCPQSGTLVLDTSQLHQIEAAKLEACYLELDDRIRAMPFDKGSPSWAQNTPHPVRRIAKGRPAFTLGIMSWADDVSGNRTKQYNPHTNVYVANTNLPHEKLQQEYFVRFCSTSPDASALEQLDALGEEIGQDKWHVAYDCILETEIIFRIISRLKPADNPQQSEECSHIGLKGNMYCRRCHVGGSDGVVETSEGFHALFSVRFDKSNRIS